MDIERSLREAAGFTPTEQQLARTILAMGERIQDHSIKELAACANASIASIHRLCKKLGLEGYKELKIELVRAATRRLHGPSQVDINFPFNKGDRAQTVLSQMASVYETTLHDTADVLDTAALDRAAGFLARAQMVDIFTQSHNLHPARMFSERLQSIGKASTCFESAEQQTRTAMAARETHVAVAISYSGLGPNLTQVLPLLKARRVPVVFIGTPHAERINPGLDVYLHVSDRESLQNRITQFASHIAVQYVLDSLFSCLFARDYDRSRAFLEQSLPYTRLPALRERGVELER